MTKQIKNNDENLNSYDKVVEEPVFVWSKGKNKNELNDLIEQVRNSSDIEADEDKKKYF